MKIVDIIFALICGLTVNWVAFDFLKSYGIDFGLYKWLLLWLLPIISLIFLWLASLIGRKLLFVFQAAKYLLVGAFVTVIDLKLFEFLVWIFSFAISQNQIIAKVTSFLFATFVKYWGNKHWAFEKPGKERVKLEVFQFFLITMVGLGIDVGFFFYLTRIMGPQLETPQELWVKLSVILAAIVAALWNFLGYKFLVFKK